MSIDGNKPNAGFFQKSFVLNYGFHQMGTDRDNPCHPRYPWFLSTGQCLPFFKFYAFFCGNLDFVERTGLLPLFILM